MVGHHFTIPTVSRSPPSAGTYLPRPLHGRDCFTVSILCTYTDLGNRRRFGVNVTLVSIRRYIMVFTYFFFVSSMLCFTCFPFDKLCINNECVSLSAYNYDRNVLNSIFRYLGTFFQQSSAYYGLAECQINITTCANCIHEYAIK